MSDFIDIQKTLRNGELTRIVAIGSSNTQRGPHSEGRYNWFDWLDVMITNAYGPRHHAINAGVSGQTSAQVKERFERDALFYEPDILFITLGGNDCNPEKDVSRDAFRDNLNNMVERTRERLPECRLIMQTYYSFDVERMEVDGQGERAKLFPEYMEIIRQFATDVDLLLVDNLARWEPLRNDYLEDYRALMRDSMHVNPMGNLVWGLDLGRHFGCEIPENLEALCAEGLEYQNLLDNLGEEDE